MLGYIRVIRQGQRYLELRGDRREIPFAKDDSYGILADWNIFFPKVWLTLAQ